MSIRTEIYQEAQKNYNCNNFVTDGISTLIKNAQYYNQFLGVAICKNDNKF